MNFVNNVLERVWGFGKTIATFLQTPVEKWSLTEARQKWLETGQGEIVIGTKTSVRGNMHADHITVKGRVNGRVTGSLISITQMGTLRGRVYAESFEVDEHATLDAQCSVREKPAQEGTQDGISSGQPG